MNNTRGTTINELLNNKALVGKPIFERGTCTNKITGNAPITLKASPYLTIKPCPVTTGRYKITVYQSVL